VKCGCSLRCTTSNGTCSYMATPAPTDISSMQPELPGDGVNGDMGIANGADDDPLLTPNFEETSFQWEFEG